MNHILKRKLNNNIVNIISDYLITFDQTIKLNKLKLIKHIDKYNEYITNQNDFLLVYKSFKQYINIHPEKIENTHFWNSVSSIWYIKRNEYLYIDHASLYPNLMIPYNLCQ